MWKVLIAKKLAITALTLGLGLYDARLTSNPRVREANPLLKPVAGSPASYLIASDSILASYGLWRHPKSKVTKALLVESIGAHAAGIAYSEFEVKPWKFNPANCITTVTKTAATTVCH